jgi:hypothetical protein
LRHVCACAEICPGSPASQSSASDRGLTCSISRCVRAGFADDRLDYGEAADLTDVIRYPRAGSSGRARS